MAEQSLLHDVLVMGVASNASDWHIKENSPINLRIDGSLVDTDFMTDSALMNQIVMEMVKDECLLDQLRSTGDLDISFVEPDVGRFRVNIHRQRGALGIAMRHVKTEIMTFNKLGMPPVIEKIAEYNRGIVIITGTTGSGKSTTLAAMLEYMNNKFRRHIITIEDPIEYEFFDKKCFFEQREVGLDSDSFYSALVHALRQDPDVIMVGEMRDRESFEAALQAADTGHLVMTTLHSTNASQSVNRILDFYDHVEQAAIRDALALNLRAIVSQRLMPKAYGGGVVPAVEIMLNTPMIRKLLERNQLEKLAQALEGGEDDGMLSFNRSLLTLINDGLITEEDAMATASNPEALKMNLQGIFLNSANQILGS